MRDPNICLIDVESTPMMGYFYDRHEPRFVHVVQESYLLSFAYKWIGRNEPARVVSQRQFKTAFKKDRTDDSRVAKALHEIHEEADLLIAHNADRFDIRKIQDSYFRNKLPRPDTTATVDTLKVIKKETKRSKNSLDHITSELGIGEKLKHPGMELWIACMGGDQAAWQTMEDYNIHDVDPLLEGLYLYMRDNNWIRNHPNMASKTGRMAACTICGKDGPWTKRGLTSVNGPRYQRVQMTNCGHYNTMRRSEPYSSPLFKS